MARNECYLFVEIRANELYNNFRVGLRLEADATCFELLFQSSAVFDGAVVHERQTILVIAVRMGVLIGLACSAHNPQQKTRVKRIRGESDGLWGRRELTAVSGPAGMGNANGIACMIGGCDDFEFGDRIVSAQTREFAGVDFHLPAGALPQSGHTSTVITAVLQD